MGRRRPPTSQKTCPEGHSRLALASWGRRHDGQTVAAGRRAAWPWCRVSRSPTPRRGFLLPARSARGRSPAARTGSTRRVQRPCPASALVRLWRPSADRLRSGPALWTENG